MKGFGSSRKSQPPVRNPKRNIEEQTVSFRRSRTLTGSASSNVTSANEPRSQLKSPRLKEHELKKHRRFVFVALAGTVMLCGACLWLLDQYIVSVNTLTSSSLTSAQTYDQARYKVAIQDYLNARPLERFRFVLKSEQLVEYVNAKYPEIKSVSLVGEKGLVATGGVIEFRKPVALWKVNAQKYYVDETGETFNKSVYGEPSVSVKDESGISIESSQLVASSRLLRFLGQTVGGVNASGIGTVTQVTIPGGTLRQLDITLNNHPYRIKTHMDREPVGQVADIAAVVHYLDSKGITTEYVDVRVKGRAYYR